MAMPAPLAAVTGRLAWCDEAGSPNFPAQPRPSRWTSLPPELSVSGAWASRMLPVAMPTPGFQRGRGEVTQRRRRRHRVAVDEGEDVAGGPGRTEVAAAGKTQVASGPQGEDPAATLHPFHGTVRAAVVDEDHLERPEPFGGQERVDARLQPRLVPVGQDDRADRRPCGAAAHLAPVLM